MEQIESSLRLAFPNGHKDFIKLCIDEMRIHNNKNRDYALEGDPLGNFKRVAAAMSQWGYQDSSIEVALCYLMKQLDAVGNMLGWEYRGAIEGVEERLKDIAIYAKLMILLYREEHGKD